MPKGQIKQKQITINKDFFELLCKAQCDREEVCSALDVSPPTLNGWIKNTYRTIYPELADDDLCFLHIKGLFSLKGKAQQKIQFLKRTQDSDNLLKLWLTNYCGISDKVEAEIKQETISIVNDMDKEEQ